MMNNKILCLLCILIFSMIMTNCIRPEWGDIKVAKISNMYTQDQIEPLTQSDFSKFEKDIKGINQYNSYSSAQAILLMAYLKAYPSGSMGGQGTDTAKFNELVTNFMKGVGSDTNILNANPKIPYRYQLDDLSAIYEYEQITKLKYQYKYLQGRNYKIYYIPIQVSLNPGKTTVEDYYAQIEFELHSTTDTCPSKKTVETDTERGVVWHGCYKMGEAICSACIYLFGWPVEYHELQTFTTTDTEISHIYLIDLFPTKIFDNRQNNYSDAMMNALLLSGSGEMKTPAVSGAAGAELQKAMTIQSKFNNIQRIPYITSYIDSDSGWNFNTTKFGWNIYPEKTLVGDELKYVQNPDSFDFLAIVAVTNEDTRKYDYFMTSRTHWSIMPEKHYGWYWRYLNPVSWFYTYFHSNDESGNNKVLNPKYNPIKFSTPLIKEYNKTGRNAVTLLGSNLDHIMNNKTNTISITYGNDTEICSKPKEIVKYYVDQSNETAIGILNSELKSDSDIYAVNYSYNAYDINDSMITDSAYIINYNRKSESLKN